MTSGPTSLGGAARTAFLVRNRAAAADDQIVETTPMRWKPAPRLFAITARAGSTRRQLTPWTGPDPPFI